MGNFPSFEIYKIFLPPKFRIKKDMKRKLANKDLV